MPTPHGTRTSSRRATCSFCGRTWQVRYDGTLRLHRDQDGHGCEGSHRRPAFYPEQPDIPALILKLIAVTRMTGDEQLIADTAWIATEILAAQR